MFSGEISICGCGIKGVGDLGICEGDSMGAVMKSSCWHVIDD